MAATQPPLQYAMQTDAALETKLCEKGLKGTRRSSSHNQPATGGYDPCPWLTGSAGGVLGVVRSL